MANNIIEQRLETYSLTTFEDEQMALKEILQEIALYSLANTDFFEHAAFHGGTALRILYKLPRFSEDLDFILNDTNPNFNWQYYTNQMLQTFESFGLVPEIQDKTKLDTTVQKLFIKDNSIGKLLKLNFHHNPKQKFKIKLEIDTNPPKFANTEVKFLDFPTDFAVVSQDLPSSMAGKLHAILCREYLKGRDWYDFLWYLRNKIKPNLEHLQEALIQTGPWQNKKITVDSKWLHKNLVKKINGIDWNYAQNDVRPFLRIDQGSLKLWTKEFFVEKVNGVLGET